MSRYNLYKLGLIAAIAAFCAFLIYPPDEQIKLGLDLEGGIHLVLNVVVDEAVAGQVRTDMGRDMAPLSPEESVRGMRRVIESSPWATATRSG